MTTDTLQLRLREGDSLPTEVKVLITGKLHPVALNILNNPPAGFALPLPLNIVNKPDCSREELLQEVATAHVLCTRSETTIDAEVLHAAKSLSLVARAAVGYGNIDLKAATDLGILVMNTPGKNTNSAAELTMGLLLSMFRNLGEAHQTVRNGGWDRHRFTGQELMGKTIGLLGLGNVGHRVAQFARGFDMKVIAYDPYIADSVFKKHGAIKAKSLEEMLDCIDVLSVHTPLNSETRGMIGEVELMKLRKGAWVVNAGRGGIIDEQALLKQLNNGYLSGAALDTWEKEPHILEELRINPKVYAATPHIGASTLEAQKRIGETVAMQILKALRGEIVDSPVNLPSIQAQNSNVSTAFTILAEKCARLGSQIMSFNPKTIHAQVNADLNKEDLRVLRLALAKGFIAATSDEFVSYVNVERLLEKRGLDVKIELSNAKQVRSNGIGVTIEGSQAQESCFISGVLFDNQHVRLTEISGYEFEIEPSGHMLVIQNHDRPGVVGDVGTFLAKNQVNIAQFELSRNSQQNRAMAIVKIDGNLEDELLGQIRKLPNIISARSISGI